MSASRQALLQLTLADACARKHNCASAKAWLVAHLHGRWPADQGQAVVCGWEEVLLKGGLTAAPLAPRPGVWRLGQHVVHLAPLVLGALVQLVPAYGALSSECAEHAT